MIRLANSLPVGRAHGKAQGGGAAADGTGTALAANGKGMGGGADGGHDWLPLALKGATFKGLTFVGKGASSASDGTTFKGKTFVDKGTSSVSDGKGTTLSVFDNTASDGKGKGTTASDGTYYFPHEVLLEVPAGVPMSGSLYYKDGSEVPPNHVILGFVPGTANTVRVSEPIAILRYAKRYMQVRRPRSVIEP